MKWRILWDIRTLHIFPILLKSWWERHLRNIRCTAWTEEKGWQIKLKKSTWWIFGLRNRGNPSSRLVNPPGSHRGRFPTARTLAHGKNCSRWIALSDFCTMCKNAFSDDIISIVKMMSFFYKIYQSSHILMCDSHNYNIEYRVANVQRA